MPSRTHPAATLGVLTALNFLNYIDRYVLFAVQPLIQQEPGFQRGDFYYGLLTTAFFCCYMIAAPICGHFADRGPRRRLVIAGAVVWSLATLLTAATRDYWALFVRHAIVGIGEATFVTIAPGYIADLFAEDKRGRKLAIFYTAIAIGPAAGYAIGGLLGHRYGWRVPFYVVAAPGLLLATLMLLLPEPKRGATDTLEETRERASILGLLHNGAYLTSTLGMAMYTFAIGGLSVWMPTFLARSRSISLEGANLLLGVMLLFGVAATLAGGQVADWWLRRASAAYYQVSAVALVLAAPLMAVAILARGTVMLVAMGAAIFMIFFNTGPLNAAVVDSVSARIRASAIAINLFAIHVLGDVPSPPLIGYISDRAHSLQAGFLATIAAIVIAAAILFYGARYAPPLRSAISGRQPAICSGRPESRSAESGADR
jgi:multidrug resistance protein